MNWTDELQSWGVALLLAAAVYVLGGYLFRSLHPTGMLNWQGRRWRKGVVLLILLNAGVFGGWPTLGFEFQGAQRSGLELGAVTLAFAIASN